MSLLGKVFGSEKALDTMVTGAVKAFDKLIYTSEEKAQDQAKAITEARGMIIAWMKSTQGQNLSRRLLALSTCGVWLSQIILAQVVAIVLVFAGDMNANELTKVIDILNTGAQEMKSVAMLVFGFYFAAPYMGKMAESFIANKSK